MKWTDKVFEKSFCQTYCRCYQRPSKHQLESASRYFLYHFIRDDGDVKDWQKTLRILLLGLCLIDPIYVENKRKGTIDKDENTYLLDNYCEQNKNGENGQSLPMADADISMEMLESQHFTKDQCIVWYAYYVSKLRNYEYVEVSQHFGCISLILCRSITHNLMYVEQDLHDTLYSIIEMVNGRIVMTNDITPLPKRVNHKMSEVFETNSSFNKEIICRLVRRRNELQRESAVDNRIDAVLSLACLYSMYQTGSGLYHWFLRAKDNLCVTNEDFFEKLRIIGGFDDVIDILQLTDLQMRNAPKTWQVCLLLHNKSCAALSLSDKKNMKAFGMLIAAGSEEKCDRNTNRFLHSIRELPICDTTLEELKIGFRIGYSIQRSAKST